MGLVFLVLHNLRTLCVAITQQERNEWGDPLASSNVWRYIRSYCPINNLREAWGRCCKEDGETAGGHDTDCLQVGAKEANISAANGINNAAALPTTAVSVKRPRPASLEAEGAPSAARSKRPPPSFPHVMVTASLHDPRVPFHGPAKYVAMLRSLHHHQATVGPSAQVSLSAPASSPCHPPLTLLPPPLSSPVALSSEEMSRDLGPLGAAFPSSPSVTWDRPHLPGGDDAAKCPRNDDVSDNVLLPKAMSSDHHLHDTPWTSTSVALLLTAMAGGHGGASSGRLSERAGKFTFLLWALNCSAKTPNES